MITRDEELIWEAYNSDSARKYFEDDALDRIGGFKSRSLLVEMPIDDFLTLAEKLPEHQVRRDAEDYFQGKGKFDDIPYLLVDGDEPYSKIIGHEGRHRALLFKKIGLNTMPVEFRDRFIRWDEVEGLPEGLYNEDGDKLFKYPIDRNGNWVGLEEEFQI